jgi:hypothetical protein
MSQQNIELIRRIFDQAPHDPDVLFESLDDEVQWEAAAIDIPDAGASCWRGPAGVREFFRRWVGPFDESVEVATGRCGPSAMGKSCA